MSLTDKVFNQVRARQLNRFKVERNGDIHVIYVQLSEIEKFPPYRWAICTSASECKGIRVSTTRRKKDVVELVL